MKIASACLLLFLGTGLAAFASPAAVDKPELALAKIRQKCLAILIQGLGHENSFVRSAALRAVGESQDSDLVGLLKKGISDASPTARLFALQALQSLSQAEARRVAVTLLADGDVWVKAAAVETLTAGQADRLASFLQEPDAPVRFAAVSTLYRLGQTQHFSVLASAAKSGDANTRYQAISYLGRLVSSEAVQLLESLLDDPDAEVVHLSLKALEEHPRSQSTDKLRVLLRHVEPNVRMQAILVLGNLPVEQRSVVGVQEMCADADPMVRLSASVALVRLHFPACKGGFEDALRHPDFAVRSSAARVLGTLPAADRVRLLALALEDAHTRVRTAAVRALGMMGGPDAFPLLLRMLDDPQEAIRAYAAGNLIKLMNY